MVRCRGWPASATAAGGCRMPPPRCRRGCSAMLAVCRSPIFALRLAARLPSSRRRVHASPRSIDRNPGLSDCGKTWSGCASPRRSSTPTPRSGRADHSTPCCSMRHASPPARSGVIQTCPGSRTRPIWRNSPRCRPDCSTARWSWCARAAHWSIAPARWSPKRASKPSPRCLSAGLSLQRRPIVGDEVGGLTELISPAGDLRTLPCHLPDPEPRMAGLDGFYAARIMRI